MNNFILISQLLNNIIFFFLNMQVNYLEKLERELKYRNYSRKTIKTYSTCINFFLKKLNKDPLEIKNEEIETTYLYNLKDDENYLKELYKKYLVKH